VKPWPRRTILATLAAGATLQAATVPRKAAAAGADGGLSKLREHAEPRTLPEGLGFTDADGKEIAFASLRGRAAVVNFWATWCPPCVAEMPSLDRLHAMVAGEGIAVLALSSDRGGKAQVQPFYQRTAIRNLDLLLDPRGAAGRALGVRGLPTTIILDRAGREVARLEGEAAWDNPQVVAAIRRLAGPAPIPNQTT
jgi:thiol-disulfide isomerase/thioredoxin